MSFSATRYFPGILGKQTEPHHASAADKGALSPESGREQPLASEEASSACTTPVRTRVESPAEPSDEALMAGICEGDEEALAGLFRRYARLVRGVAYRVLRDASEADDLLQDIFILIHRKCRTFDGSKSPARFWILQMTYHRAISRRRYLDSRHFYTRSDLDELGGELPDPRTAAGRYEDTIAGVLGSGGLEQLFEELSENQRQTLRLYFFEGYTLEEIAVKLEQSRGNVKNHYFRGLEKLRKQIFGR